MQDNLPGSLRSHQHEWEEVPEQQEPKKKNCADYGSFILQHAQYLTVGEMAIELDVNPRDISRWCYKLGIRAITKGEQTRQYLEHMVAYKTTAELAAKLEVDEKYINDLCTKYNLVTKENRAKSLTPRKIFQRISGIAYPSL